MTPTQAEALEKALKHIEQLNEELFPALEELIQEHNGHDCVANHCLIQFCDSMQAAVNALNVLFLTESITDLFVDLNSDETEH